jgi:hypothetical protein
MATAVVWGVFGASLPIGTANKQLDPNIIDISPYDQIRVFALEDAGSAGPVDIILTPLFDGNVPLGTLDTLSLKPGSQVTNVYETVGTQLLVTATATGASGSSSVTVVIYGSGVESTTTTPAPAPTPGPTPKPTPVITPHPVP